ncbi:MAG: response regulator [Verrucomicrobiia bacterium]
MKVNRTILFVETDATVLATYGKLLQREGFRVESAQDGLDALKALSQLRPDLVVLELMLPTFDGAEVLKFIRADPRLKAVPVIIFTDDSATELLQDPLLASGTKYMAKSDCTPPDMLQVIQEMLMTAPSSNSTADIVKNDFAPAIKLRMADPGAPKDDEDEDEEVPGSAATTKERADFLREAPAEITKVRELCLAYLKSPTSAPKLQTFSQSVSSLSANASKAGCARIVPLTKAFEVLLSRIMAKPSLATPSILQTIAEAADCLGLLLRSAEASSTEPAPKAKVLAVDDDTVCNHVIGSTLKRANLDISSVEDPLEGLRLLEASHYDLVLLDIDMPKMTGFEVCEKLRRLPNYKTTPVIFVTAHSNFENRTKGVLSGGNYFIAKPIDPSELALKVTIHLFKAQVQNASRQDTKPETEPQTNGVTNGAPVVMAPPVAPPPPVTPPPLVAPLPPVAPPAPVAPIQASQYKNGNGRADSVVPPVVTPPTNRPYTNGDSEVIPPPVAPIQVNQTQNGNGNGRTKSPELPNVPLPTTRPRTMDIPKKGAPQLPLPQKVADVGMISGNRLSGSRNRNSNMNNEQDETFEKVVVAVVRIIFGDDNLTDMNVRLVRIALERYNVPEIINSPVAA